MTDAVTFEFQYVLRTGTKAYCESYWRHIAFDIAALGGKLSYEDKMGLQGAFPMLVATLAQI